MSQKTLQEQLDDALEENLVLQQDVRDFCFVNYEIMKLFGVTIDTIANDDIDIWSVIKSIKDKIGDVMIDPQGFASLLSHFQDEAIRIGMKYKDLAEEISAKKAANK